MPATIMLLLLATPLFVGFGTVIMPIQSGAPNVAFPRLNFFATGRVQSESPAFDAWYPKVAADELAHTEAAHEGRRGAPR
jgi:hypothetical protein